ncbi:Transmembrane protein 14C, partial [Tieghemiomyces parasiticus]
MDYLGFAYAGTVALGGVMGFVKAGSMPSLAAGLAMGGLMALGAQRASNNPHDVYLAL